jgi:hypothetical protein
MSFCRRDFQRVTCVLLATLAACASQPSPRQPQAASAAPAPDTEARAFASPPPAAPAAAADADATEREAPKDAAKRPSETPATPAPQVPRTRADEDNRAAPAKAGAPAGGRAAPAAVADSPPSDPGSASRARAAAMIQADRVFESARRELDVAAGDCPGACRALGSMDRAAGTICQLSHGDAPNRCDSAKSSLFAARDRVRATCGECPWGPSVDRAAPVPSRR